MTATARRKRPKSRHEKLIKEMEDRRKMWERSGRDIEMTVRLRKSDYRYWMLVRAGLWAEDPETYRWWCRLHWMQREAWFRQGLSLLCVSDADIAQNSADTINFFRNML